MTTVYCENGECRDNEKGERGRAAVFIIPISEGAVHNSLVCASEDKRKAPAGLQTEQEPKENNSSSL